MKTNIFNYTLFGKNVSSEIPLGKLPPAGGGETHFMLRQLEKRIPAQELVWFHRIRLPGVSAPTTSFARWNEHFLVRFHGYCDFLLLANRKDIYFKPRNKRSLEDVQALFLTQLLPLALNHTGACVLHASAVQIGNTAVAFIGNHAQGKSTLAAAFAAAGYPLVCDDGLLVERVVCGGRQAIQATPSFPEIRIETSTITQLFGEDKARTAIPAFKNSRGRITVPFSDTKLELGALYLLEANNLLQASKAQDFGMAAHVADRTASWTGLLKNTFRLNVDDKQAIREEFSMLSSVLASVPVKTLSYPRNLQALASVIDFTTSSLQATKTRYSEEVNYAH